MGAARCSQDQGGLTPDPGRWCGEPGSHTCWPTHHTGSRIIASSIFHKSCPQEMGFLRRREEIHFISMEGR